MLQIERTLVNTESAYVANEIEYRKLEQLHMQFGSIELQATLVVGFVFTTMNADNLVALGDDQGKYCLYKAPFKTHLYIICTVCAVGLCMSCVMISAYIVWRSQTTANDVSVKHTIALVRSLRIRVMTAYFAGMVSFFASFLLLIWIYFAEPNWLPLEDGVQLRGQQCGSPESTFEGHKPYIDPNNKIDMACNGYEKGHWDSNIIRDRSGNVLIKCLNPFEPTQQKAQQDIGLSVATVGSVVSVLLAIGAIMAVCHIRKRFDDLERSVEMHRQRHLAQESTSTPSRREGPSVQLMPKH